jgi:hypothetical protein
MTRSAAFPVNAIIDDSDAVAPCPRQWNPQAPGILHWQAVQLAVPADPQAQAPPVDLDAVPAANLEMTLKELLLVKQWT